MAIASIDLTGVAAGTGGFVIRGEAAGNEAGYSVASAGDVNGDGFGDLLIGAPFAANDSTGDDDTGKAYVVFGTAAGATAAIDLSSLGSGGFVIRGEDTLDQAGLTVAAAGDINGDGRADIAIGTRSADGPDDVRPSAGATYVIFGTASPGTAVNLSAIAAGTGGFIIHGAAAGDQSGASIAAGDANGDGIDDLLIGAPLSDGTGAGFVVFGRTTGFGNAIDLLDIAAGIGGFKLSGTDSGDASGTSVALGDVTGDGIADLLLGAPGADGPANATAGAGGGHLVVGRTALGAPVALGEAGGVVAGMAIHGRGGQSGAAVAMLGDINGDGVGDFALSAQQEDSERGRTYVVFGNGAGLPATLNLADVAAGTGGFVIQGQGVGDLSGYGVAGAGDLNADGIDDILIGARGAASLNDGRIGAGEAYVLLGSADGFGNQVAMNTLASGDGGFALYGQDSGDRAGSAVSSAGDLNGDGFADLAIGAPLADGKGNTIPTAGETYILYGSDIAGTVTHAGDSKDNTLNGTAGADAMVGGHGADILVGNGGADAMAGGAGNDTLRIADFGFRRVDGGSGTDTLAFDGSGMLITLPDMSGARIRDIEQFDITGTGANTIVVNTLAVMRMSSTTNTLRVIADAGDVVDLAGEAWTTGATLGGFTTYLNGSATLEISASATVMPCFAAGTRILTTCGEVAVEDLAECDLAVVAGGGTRKVRWVGRRTVRLACHPRPWDVNPVRVRAHAFGPGMPHRDLRLSPDHAIHVPGVPHGGALVPVRHLVNGASIAQESAGDITYLHVELEGEDGRPTHDILLAEGLAVESFLDTGNRSAFANGGTVAMAQPDFALRRWEAEACAPLLRDGPALQDMRTHLLAEATALGWEITPDPDLRLVVEGRAIWPQFIVGDYVLRLPAGAQAGRLRSRSTVPAWLRDDTDDRRVLGVAVTRLALDGMAIALDDPRLDCGWHDPEGAWRWTAGDAAVPLAGARELRIRVAPLERYWRRPKAVRRSA